MFFFPPSSSPIPMQVITAEPLNKKQVAAVETAVLAMVGKNKKVRNNSVYYTSVKDFYFAATCLLAVCDCILSCDVISIHQCNGPCNGQRV